MVRARGIAAVWQGIDESVDIGLEVAGEERTGATRSSPGGHARQVKGNGANHHDGVGVKPSSFAKAMEDKLGDLYAASVKDMLKA